MLVMQDPESDVTILIDLPADRQAALSRQLRRSREAGHRDGFRDHIAQALVEAINTRLDWDLLPPTEPQKSFAVSVSDGLGVEIPEEALRFRGAMSAFLTEHADRLRVLQVLKASALASALRPEELNTLRPKGTPPLAE